MPMVETNLKEIMQTIKANDKTLDEMIQADECYVLVNSKGLLNPKYAKYLLQAFSKVLNRDLLGELSIIK